MAGLLGGDVQMMIDLMVSVYPNAKAGKLKGLAVTTKQRVPTAPDVPTLDEAGVAGFDMAASDGVYAPAGTPKAVVDKLNAAFRQALEDPQVRDNLISRGAFPVPGTPDDLAQHVAPRVSDVDQAREGLGREGRLTAARRGRHRRRRVPPRGARQLSCVANAGQVAGRTGEVHGRRSDWRTARRSPA